MKTKEIFEKVGKEATITINGLTIIVKVKDAKFAYGKARFLVTPKSGKGEVWMQDVNFG